MFNKKRVLPLALAFMMGLTSVPVAPLNVMAEENTQGQVENSENNVDPSSTKPNVANSSEYHYVWSDEFNGTELNRNIWNVETHDPGWVNAELQAYVNTDENIYLEDGKLVIKPIKTEQLLVLPVLILRT